MKIRLLSVAMLAGLAVAQSVSAQEFDSRWYLTGSTGFNFQDSDRGTSDAPFVGLGLGKFVSPNWAIDGELNYQNPNLDSNRHLNWSQYGVSLDFRRFWLSEGREYNPYMVFGVGYQRAEESFDAFPNPASPGRREQGNLAAKIGAGLQTTFDSRVAVRAELAYRADFDDRSVNAPTEDWFGDLLASIGVVIPLGPAPVAAAPAPAPAPVAPPPPPPPAPITIDLKGVNFDFDKATLRPDALAILGDAAEILRRYPELRVEVAGHTDLCGPEAYNQKLSERRAKTVYDYLATNGIDSSRLSGPVGYGESRPLVSTPQTMPGCKSEENRRTELNVQN